jgi:hypothetical protein
VGFQTSFWIYKFLSTKVEEPYEVIGTVFFLESILKEYGF